MAEPIRADADVVALLQEQHREIQRLFGEVDRTHGSHRSTALQDLMALLAAHETAEAEIVHPEVRRMHGGAPIADARIDEERRLEAAISELQKVEPDHEDFRRRLLTLRDQVISHNVAEERDEFPMIRIHLDDDRLRHLADQVRRAEDLAPSSARSDRPLYVGTPADFDGSEVHVDDVLLGPFQTVAAVVREAMRTEEDRWREGR